MLDAISLILRESNVLNSGLTVELGITHDLPFLWAQSSSKAPSLLEELTILYLVIKIPCHSKKAQISGLGV